MGHMRRAEYLTTDSRSNLAPSTKGCSKLRVLGLVGVAAIRDVRLLSLYVLVRYRDVP